MCQNKKQDYGISILWSESVVIIIQVGKIVV